MSRGLLPGGETDEQRELVRLKRELAGLETELQRAKEELATTKQAAADSIQAIRAIREVLEPFHTAMKMLFGEIDRISVGDAGAPRGSNHGPSNSKLEMLKQKLGGRQAEFIELLEHGPMTGAQLKAAAHCGLDTVYQTVKRLKAAGVIQKNGNHFSLSV
jgi:hypothetical protein